MTDVQQMLSGFASCGGTAAELASFLRGVRKEGGSVRQLAGIGRDSERLLSLDVLKEWPEDDLGLYLEFLSAMPYCPDLKCMPCGRKERFIAEALTDMSVPKPVRIALWRTFAMNGFRFPRYAKGEWDVPLALIDHMYVRGWMCAKRVDGWKDLRNSNPSCFSDKTPDLGSDLEKSAWEAIAEDSPSGLLMPLTIAGKGLPLVFFREVLRARAVKTLVYLITNDDLDLGLLPPREILLYVCANWNNDEAIPIVSLLEKSNPGLVANTEDCYGHNALWYTLYQRDALGVATPAARREMDPLDVHLIKLGCDPAKECFLGLSWQDVAEDRQSVEQYQARFSSGVFQVKKLVN